MAIVRPCVRFRVDGLELTCNRVQLLAGRLDRDARFETSDRHVNALKPARGDRQVGEDPDVGGRGAIGELEPLRHHADDRVGLPVERYPPVVERRRRPETATPEMLAHDGDVRRVVGGERAANERLDAQQLEQLAFGGDGGDSFRRCGVVQIPVRGRVGDHRLQRPAALAGILEIEDAHDVELHQATGVRKRQRAQQHTVYDAEDRGRGASAQREDEQRGQGETGSFPKSAHGRAEDLAFIFRTHSLPGVGIRRERHAKHRVRASA